MDFFRDVCYALWDRKDWRNGTMSKTKEVKTNAMRMLDRMKIPYEAHTYECEEFVDGIQVADMLHLPHEKVYKTLVTVGKSKEHYVFVVPVSKELNLKKAAQCVGEKSIEMIKSKELLPLTGYVHGGCSPIGMKKQFVTTIDRSAEQFDKIMFSAGKIGYQVEVSLRDLGKVIRYQTADIAE